MGVVFYQMLTGRLPFPGPDFLAQKNEQRYPPPSRIAAAVSVDSDPVLIKAMAPKPEDRHPSADAFAKELSLLAHLHH
jgi:serine/threonine-protein kinase